MEWAIGHDKARHKMGLAILQIKKMLELSTSWRQRVAMKEKAETTIVFWRYIRIMEKKMGTTIVYCPKGPSIQ